MKYSRGEKTFINSMCFARSSPPLGHSFRYFLDILKINLVGLSGHISVLFDHWSYALNGLQVSNMKVKYDNVTSDIVV